MTPLRPRKGPAIGAGELLPYEAVSQSPVQEPELKVRNEALVAVQFRSLDDATARFDKLTKLNIALRDPADLVTSEQGNALGFHGRTWNAGGTPDERERMRRGRAPA